MTDTTLARLPNPDMVGTSEYRALYELVSDVAASALYDDEDPVEFVFGSLDELAAEIERVRGLLSRATTEVDPWDLTRQRHDDYDDWRGEVHEGATLRGFAEFVAARDEHDIPD